jgi:hypothetical protein
LYSALSAVMVRRSLVLSATSFHKSSAIFPI